MLLHVFLLNNQVIAGPKKDQSRTGGGGWVYLPQQCKWQIEDILPPTPKDLVLNCPPPSDTACVKTA